MFPHCGADFPSASRAYRVCCANGERRTALSIARREAWVRREARRPASWAGHLRRSGDGHDREARHGVRRSAPAPVGVLLPSFFKRAEKTEGHPPRSIGAADRWLLPRPVSENRNSNTEDSMVTSRISTPAQFIDPKQEVILRGWMNWLDIWRVCA